jgi:hypothetical protein
VSPLKETLVSELPVAERFIIKIKSLKFCGIEPKETDDELAASVMLLI